MAIIENNDKHLKENYAVLPTKICKELKLNIYLASCRIPRVVTENAAPNATFSAHLFHLVHCHQPLHTTSVFKYTDPDRNKIKLWILEERRIFSWKQTRV